MKVKNKEILKRLSSVQKAEDKLDEVVNKVQASCPHNNIAECDYQPSEFFSANPPIRICLECGLSEEGWGCGYSVLVEKQNGLSLRQISRDTLYSMRVGKFIRQGD